MKKLYFLAAATAIIAMGACGNKTKGDVEGLDTIGTDSVGNPFVVDNSAPPAFLYYYGPDNMCVLYWMIAEPTPSDEEWYEPALASWKLQERIHQNAEKYTKLFMGEDVFDVKFVAEQLKNPDGGDLPTSIIHNKYNQGAGLTYAFKDPNDKRLKDEDWGGMCVLVTDEYLKTHKPLAIKPYSQFDVEPPFQDEILKTMEAKYNLKVQTSCKVFQIGDRYDYGVIQFKPKDNKVMALDVVIDNKENKTYIRESEGDCSAGEFDSVWNVDDGGEYYPSHLLMAFDGPLGCEICFVRGAPESLTWGVMRLNGEELVRQDYDCAYVYVDEGIPFWKKDLAECVKLYNADDPENKHNELCKWIYIDIDNDGQDEVWLCDKEEKNHAFFSHHDNTFKLLCTVDQRLSVKIYNNRISVSGPAGGPAWYYADYLIKDSKVEHRFTMTEVYGEPDNCSLDGKELPIEEGVKYREALPSQEHWLNEHYWNTFDNE